MYHSTRHTELVMSVANPAVLSVLMTEMGFKEPGTLENTGITQETLDDFRNHISFNQYKLLIKNALKISENPHLGLQFGHRLGFTGYNMMGMGAVASETFWQVLSFVKRATVVINPSVNFVISVDKNRVNVDIEETVPWGDAHTFIIDTLISSCHDLVSLFDPEVAKDLIYYIDYPAPENTAFFDDYVTGKLVFNSPYNRFSIPAKFCYRPLPLHSPSACHQAESELQKFLETIDNQHQALLLTIKEILVTQSGGILSFEEVADHLHVSPRTLNRRLKAIGTTFKEIVSDVRKRLAVEYLSGHKLSIDEIAYRLGYGDPSNFSKAFRKWTGYSPSQYKEKFLAH